MVEHIVIRKEEFVTGSCEKPESTVFTQTHKTHPPIPYNRIKIGETIWVKWSGGSIVAKAKVEGGLRLLENCSPKELKQTVRGTRLYDHKEYWDTLPPQFYGMIIYVADSHRLEKPIQPQERSYGSGWVVLDDEEKKKDWLH